MRKKLQTLLFLSLLFTSLVSAQDGVYDVRFNLNSIDCNNMTVFIDVELRASDAATTFNVSDQNYRFSFNREALANPYIVSEHLTSAGTDPCGGFYAYNPHTLTGSADTVVSLNLELAFGDGYCVDTEWVPITRMGFELLDVNACFELIWHTHAPEDFPPTFIGEKFNGNLYEADEALYGNNSTCIGPGCVPLPINLKYFKANSEDCNVALSWGTEQEVNNSHFEIYKSKDGVSYEKIANIEGAGTSETPVDYTFIDKDVNAVTNYYLLRQVDFDGNHEDFGPKVIKSTCFEEGIANGISELYPNPVGNESLVHVNFYSTADYTDAEIVVSDVLGRVIESAPVSVEEGANLLKFNHNALAAGTYYLQVRGTDWYTDPQKFVKID